MKTQAKIHIEKQTTYGFEGYIEAHELPKYIQDQFPGEEAINVCGDFFIEWDGEIALPYLDGGLLAYKGNLHVDIPEKLLNYEALQEEILEWADYGSWQADQEAEACDRYDYND